jgi:hypothetical protein
MASCIREEKEFIVITFCLQVSLFECKKITDRGLCDEFGIKIQNFLCQKFWET